MAMKVARAEFQDAKMTVGKAVRKEAELILV